MENIEYSEPMGYFPKAARPFVDKAMESIGGVRYVQQYTESGRPTMENTAQAAPAPGSPAPSSSKGGPAPTKSKTWKKVKAAVDKNKGADAANAALALIALRDRFGSAK